MGLKVSRLSQRMGVVAVGGRSGRPRFRLAPDLAARIEALAPLYGGRDGVVGRALDLLEGEGVVSRLQAACRELAQVVSDLRALAGDLGGAAEAVGELKAVVRRLEDLAARLGEAPPRDVALQPVPDEAEIKDYYLRVLEEFRGARLKGEALGGGGL